MDADGQRARGQAGRHRRDELLGCPAAGCHRGRAAGLVRPRRPGHAAGRLHPRPRNEMTRATKTRTGTLDDIAPGSQVFSIIAMDQPKPLRGMCPAGGLDASDDDLRAAKADVARVLTPAASGLLSDPTYGVPPITGAAPLAPTSGSR